MSANVPLNGSPRQLDRRPEPPTQVTEEQAADAGRLARLLMTLLRDTALLRRRWMPHRLDYEDRAVDDTGTTKYRFTHLFGARVRWWVVDWDGAASPALTKDADTTDDVLVLTSTSAGTMTLRIEEAG